MCLNIECNEEASIDGEINVDVDLNTSRAHFLEAFSIGIFQTESFQSEFKFGQKRMITSDGGSLKSAHLCHEIDLSGRVRTRYIYVHVRMFLPDWGYTCTRQLQSPTEIELFTGRGVTSMRTQKTCKKNDNFGCRILQRAHVCHEIELSGRTHVPICILLQCARAHVFVDIRMIYARKKNDNFGWRIPSKCARKP